jgi:hypothetical protein
LLVAEEPLDIDHPAEPGYGRVRGIPEKIQAYGEQDGIEDARDNDPFPQLMAAHELMGPGISLKGYDDFL